MNPTLTEIEIAVSTYYNISRKDLKGPKRTAELVYPRKMAYLISRRLTGRSLPEIGRHYGRRDHTTVMSGIKSIKSDNSRETEFAAKMICRSLNKLMEVTKAHKTVNFMPVGLPHRFTMNMRGKRIVTLDPSGREI